MAERIGFRETSRFLGRNGMFKSCGLALTRMHDNGELLLEPITVRNKAIGRCQIVVPKDSVSDVIDALIAMEFETV